jgi:hypothetical protein
MNENPAITTVVTVVIMLAALGYIISRFMGHGNPAPKIPTTSYFSDDDGKTWFIDDAKNIPPFDHNGKIAYRAVLFKCMDGKPFVERLECFDDEAKTKIQEDIQAGKPALAAEYQFAARGMKIKRPGDTKWVELKEGDSAATIAFGEIMSARCPDGSLNARPVSVEENAQP